MRLLLNYKGINKVMLNVQSYNDIVRFVRENFFLKLSKWSMSYTDSDGDQISLDSQLDFQTMLDTIGKEHLKVYIKDRVQGENEHQNGQQIDIDIQPTESKIEKVEQPKLEVQQKIEEQKIEIQTEKKTIEEIIPEKSTEIKEEISSGQANENGNFDFSKCNRGMWKKRIEQEMAKFVDERVESLLPCIIKKVEDQLKNKESKPAKVEGVKHEAKCNGCGVQQIVGIRYKCVKCPNFNFCQNCEEQITHEHNMIKMKKIEEKPKEQEEFPGWKPWGKRFHPGFMPPPPFKMGENAQMPKFPYPGPPPFMHIPSHPVAGFMILNKKEQKDRSCDPRLKITKKCFKMSKLFGGQPKNYQEFVTKNQDLKLDELSQVYVAMNEGANVKGEQIQKSMERVNKLAFYFKQTPEKYIELVKKNPAANLKQLIKLATENKQLIKQDKKQQQKPEIKVQQVKVEPKLEQKMEQKKEQTKQPALIIAPRTSFFARKGPLDIKKRNECVLALKDLFGDQKVYEYISFFNENSDLSKQELIQNYIEKLSSKK